MTSIGNVNNVKAELIHTMRGGLYKKEDFLRSLGKGSKYTSDGFSVRICL